MKKEKPVSKRLFIGSLPYRFTEGELLSLFIPYGKIVAVRIMHNQWGKSRGLGYVEYEEIEDAIQAKAKLHNYQLVDRTIIVDYAQPDPFLTPEGKARHEEAQKRHSQKFNKSNFLAHPDSDQKDYFQKRKSSLYSSQNNSKKHKSGKPVFNSLGKSLNRNTSGEYNIKFVPEAFPVKKKRYIAKPGQKPEYKSSSPLHVRSSVFKQRAFGARSGAKFAHRNNKK